MKKLLDERIKSIIMIIFLYTIILGLFFYYCSKINKDNQKNIKHEIVNQENMPHLPDFPPGKGVLIYPDKGLLIIKFPDNIKIIVEKEGIQ